MSKLISTAGASGVEVSPGTCARSAVSSSGIGRRLSALGASVLGLAFATAAAAVENIYEPSSGDSRFKSAPKAPDAQSAEAAAENGGMILGLIHENTLFFIAAGVIAVFWFTVGGGRKPKVGRTGH